MSVIRNISIFNFIKPLKLIIMKKLNLALSVVAFFSVVLILSSFTSAYQENVKVGTIENCIDSNIDDVNASNNGNGNVVTIDNGQSWIWIADNCSAPWVPSTSARVQTATNGFWNVTVTFQLPEGHCDIPAIGARVTHYSEDSWAIINSNGKVIAKIVYNPNGN